MSMRHQVYNTAIFDIIRLHNYKINIQVTVAIEYVESTLIINKNHKQPIFAKECLKFT